MISPSPVEAGPANERRERLAIAAQRLMLGAAPAALTAWLLYSAMRVRSFIAGDFYDVYLPAAHRLVHGSSPYAVAPRVIKAGAGFVYPPLAAAAFVPFALVESELADHLYVLVCLMCVLGALRTTGVRDWRVYGVTLLWYPEIIGWLGENVSVPLMLLVALAWRHRNRPWVAGLITAVAISLKPFVWPLALWLLVTRRWRGAAWTLGFGLVINAVAWALVGFAQIHTYLHLSAQDADALWRGGYSMIAAAHHLGFSRSVGYGLLLAVSLVSAVALVRMGWTRSRDREAFVLAVLLMLVASPLVWIHYFVLLLVPLAISRPRFDLAWALPLAMWLLPSATRVSTWQFALAWVLVAGCFAAALRVQAAVQERPLAHAPAQPPRSPALTG